MKVETEDDRPSSSVDSIVMFLYIFAYVFRKVIINFKGQYSNILRSLEFLLLVVCRIFFVYDTNIQISSFAAFPRIAMSKYLWNLQKLLSFIACFFLQLSRSIFFKIGIFDQPRRKLKTKITDWRPKISNHNKIQGFVFALEDRKYLNTINVEVSLDSTRSIR